MAGFLLCEAFVVYIRSWGSFLDCGIVDEVAIFVFRVGGSCRSTSLHVSKDAITWVFTLRCACLETGLVIKSFSPELHIFAVSSVAYTSTLERVVLLQCRRYIG